MKKVLIQGAGELYRSDIGASSPIVLHVPDIAVVSTSVLHSLSCVVEAQEPVRVQAFAVALGVENFNETVIR